mgnify:CR=1 FL=1
MSKMSFVTDMILDTFKRVLVRFKNAKFGLLFFINIFKLYRNWLEKQIDNWYLFI